MKKHLIFCGAPELDLSGLLRAELGPALSVAGGYITERVSAPEEALCVALLPAAAAGGVAGFESHIVYDCSDGSAHKDNEVFRTEGVRLLEEAAYYPFAVLDRFGGYELVVPQYRQALADLLSSEQPLLGILLTREEAISLGNSLGLGERFELLVERLHEALREDADTLLLPVDAGGLVSARRILRQWAQEYVFS